MIGSSTLIVKQNGKYYLHIYSGLLGMICWDKKDATKQDVFKKVKRSEADWGTPDKSNLTESEVETVRMSHQCYDKNQSDYSEFAGDTVNLLDLDAGKLFGRDGKNGYVWIEYCPLHRPIDKP